MPFRGVRISWASVASASSVASARRTRAGRPRRRPPPFRRGLRTPYSTHASSPTPHAACHAWFHQTISPSADVGFAAQRCRRSGASQASPARRRMSTGVFSRGPQLTQGRRLRGFGQLAAFRVDHQAMMVVVRRMQSKQRLQHAVYAGGCLQVLPAHHMRYAMQRVVDDHREMIAGRRLLAPQHDVAPGLRVRPSGFRALLPDPVPTSTQVSAPVRATAAFMSRGAARRDHRPRCAARVLPASASWQSRYKAAPRRDRAANALSPLAPAR